MNPLSARVRKRRAPQPPLPNLHQTPSVLRRRSSRIQSRRRSVSISHILGSYYEFQSALEQRPLNPQPLQPIKATSHTRVNKARSFLDRPDPTGCAYVRTFTTDGTTLNTYAHYSFESEGQVKYHQNPTSSSFLISSFEDFKKSRRRLRNLQDNAEEASKKLRDELNKKRLANHRSPVVPSVPAETADPIDYNSCDYNDEEDPNNQLLAEDRTSFSTNDQYNSYEQTPATDNIYAPPYASLQEINQDESFVQIPAPSYAIFPPNDEDNPFTQVSTANNGYTSPDGPTFSPVTPPQSEDTSLPLESREDIDQSNGRGHKRIRRT